MITLYEYLKMSQNDYDTYDTKFDAIVTVCFIDDEDACDDYDRFCIAITKKVNVIEVNREDLVVNWSEFIERNIEKFKEFTNKYWKYNYEDDIDELVYQWINEIHAYLAGYVSESFYTKLIKFIENLEQTT